MVDSWCDATSGVVPPGDVFEAADTTTQRAVALKVLLPNFRLTRGARGRIEHAQLVDAFAVGTFDDRRTYLATELVRGADATALGLVPVGRALEIGRSVLEGLGCAHRAGVAHLHLKPSNVMIETDGTVRVLDIAINRVCGPTGVVSPYSAPEQANGGIAGPAADFFALGRLLIYLLTGRVPSGPAMVRATTRELEFLLWRALQPDPRDRFRDAADMIVGVENALRSVQR